MGERLEEGVERTDQCPGETFRYYELLVEDASKVIVITAEPADEESDPDIYVSNSCRPTQENYVWKSANIGADRLEIHPNDDHFTTGLLHVGIYAFKSSANTYRLKYTLAPADPVKELPALFSTEVSNWDYYRFKVNSPGESRLEIAATCPTGQVALFLSPSIYYPNEHEHQWSAGYFDEAVLKQVTPAYTDSPDEYVELDAFDQFMPRNGLRRPGEREIDAHDRVIAHKREFAEARNAPADTETGTTRLCIETDDWKYSTQQCYLSIKNTSNEPTSCTITRREVRESDLLPTDLQASNALFHAIFSEIDGSSVSQSERKRLQVLCQSEFTYGEIEFEHMIALLQLCAPKPGDVFWDLGSGAGKCLIAAALLCPQLGSVNGVEYLPGLFTLSQEMLTKAYTLGVRPINVVLGDMLKVDWSNADLIFTSSICFPQELIEGLLVCARQLKKGARLITLRSLPPNDVFIQTHALKVKMTWGKTGLYIFQKAI